MVVEFSKDTAGITYGKTICGDVLGYDAAGSDDGLSPMVTPGTTITPAPSQQFLPMWIGRLYW